MNASRRHLHAQLAVVSGICGAAVLVSAWWAFASLPASSPVSSEPPSPAMATPAPVMAVANTRAWSVTLWRPLRDEPTQAAPTAAVAALHIQLFSILHQGPTVIAALDLQDGNGLVYAKAGDTVQGYRVEAIDATGVQVSSGGRSQRLELGQ